MFQGDGLNVAVVCHVLCMSAKPGVCPNNNLEDAVSGVCAEMCSDDSDCPKNQKCCSNGCGHQCMPPYKGICHINVWAGFLASMCVLWCFFVFYWSFCHSFSVMIMSAGPAKPGVCPKNNVEVAVSGVCAEMCSHDSDCPKKQKCCSNGCGHKCVAPYKGICFIVFFLVIIQSLVFLSCVLYVSRT